MNNADSCHASIIGTSFSGYSSLCLVKTSHAIKSQRSITCMSLSLWLGFIRLFHTTKIYASPACRGGGFHGRLPSNGNSGTIIITPRPPIPVHINQRVAVGTEYHTLFVYAHAFIDPQDWYLPRIC
jgi:hypothetical protein